MKSKQTKEHDESTCPDCLESALHAARSTIETLAAALRDCVQSLKRLPDAKDAYRVTVIKQAEQALAALTTKEKTMKTKTKPLARLSEKPAPSGKWVVCSKHFGVHLERVTCETPRE